jgi:hypothetical protein
VSHRRTPRLLAAVSLLLLVCLGAAILENALVHTDDGCRVEVHCLACRWALSAVVDLAIAPPVARIETIQLVVTKAIRPAASAVIAVPESRGPPPLA